MDWHLACDAVDAADDVLHRGFLIDVEKAGIDPLDPQGFLRIVARLSAAMRGVTREEEASAMKAAIRALDVDWVRLTPAARERVVAAARMVLGNVPQKVLPALGERFRIVGARTMKGTRETSNARFALNIGISLSQRDLVAERFVRASTLNFVTDTYGVRRDEVAAQAREIVARGLEEGLGSDAITEELHKQLGEQLMRGKGYWNTVAMQFTNQARTFSQVNAYAEAGIVKYAFEAILDEVTTDQCRFMHGKVFTVGGAVALGTRLMQSANPTDVKSVNPWMRTGKDEAGNRILYFERGGERVLVAQVDRSGIGSSDDVGEYSSGMSPKQLEEAGIPWPPCHGKCRSTIIPEV